MYKWIVERKVRATFAELSQGNHDAMLATLAPTFRYRFAGESPLSGSRTTLDSMRRWWQRVDELLPGAAFVVDKVVVQGPPWNTEVATHVSVHATLGSGREYTNEFMQFLHLRFGSITRVETLEDTARLDGLVAELASAGVPAATEAPIIDVT